ncbi:D-alanyl-D-alanine carboxypeptidase family protein [Halalkalibacter sp. APA_J-10(15)]|uniref:D-alanyl-D-alanine carboxypeptidase family protein n=1 Tax=Halalkalibacter sp. APA_J-10(15) TaxID=2933805 RepID=UPI0027962972|nr:D-alanyl-D-alanine carboxypeptidase family protein [Halalkalibacter sp. APA_J-10(15)]
MRFSTLFFCFLAMCYLFIPLPIYGEELASLHSETAVLMDTTSGNILYEQDSQQQMYPASITKILTAIMAIEKGHVDDTVVVPKEATEVIGTRVYLLEDEEVSLLTLIQGLLINSGNDAGTAIAHHISGSEEAFALEMNRFIHDEIGVSRTNFTNPHGLFDENHITTAYDMAKITQYALENELFREIVAMKEMEWNGEGWETIIYNHHRMLWDYEGTTGVKNGFVRKSGYTLVTSAERDGMELIAVTLNSPSASHAYEDTAALLDYGFDSYELHTLESGEKFKTDTKKVFQLNDDVHYVQKKGEKSSVYVNDSGLLRVVDENNNRLMSSILELVETEKSNEDVIVEEGEESAEDSNSFFYRILSYFGWVS